MSNSIFKLGKAIGQFRALSSKPKKALKMVIAINGVDLMEPGNWDHMVNLPSEEQEVNIKKKCEALASRLSRETGVPKDQIAYYSALQYYRLNELLAAMVIATPNGFVWGGYCPKSFVEKVDPMLREQAIELRNKKGLKLNSSALDYILAALKEKLPKDKYEQIVVEAGKQMAIPPKVALLGQAGVGKTTTICSLMGVDPESAENMGLRISHVQQGTTDLKSYDLKTDKGTVSLIDLPGYGVSSEDDERYYEIYRKIIPSCDVVLLVLKATNKAIAQDELMIKNVKKWLRTTSGKEA